MSLAVVLNGDRLSFDSLGAGPVLPVNLMMSRQAFLEALEGTRLPTSEFTKLMEATSADIPALRAVLSHPDCPDVPAPMLQDLLDRRGANWFRSTADHAELGPLVQALLDRGASPVASGDQPCRLLYRMVGLGDPHAVQALIDAGPRSTTTLARPMTRWCGPCSGIGRTWPSNCSMPARHWKPCPRASSTGCRRPPGPG